MLPCKRRWRPRPPSTPTRRAGGRGKRKAWLWTATTPALSLFRIDPCRSRAALERLLPPAAPGARTVTSDRHRAYTHLRGDEHQLCWSHLIRDFTALAELMDGGQATGVAALAIAAELSEHWHAFRAGEIERATLQQRLRPLQARLGRLLRRARDSGHWKGAGLARNLLRHWPSLWTFTRVPGVELTNNAAERAVRPAVLWRKRSFGNQGAGGRVFAERLLTVAGSLRLQGRGVFAYLQAAVRAGRTGGAPLRCCRRRPASARCCPSPRSGEAVGPASPDRRCLILP
jgi:transposase